MRKEGKSEMKIKIDDSSKNVDIVEVKHEGTKFRLQSFTETIPMDANRNREPNVCRIEISDMSEVHNLLCAFEEMNRQVVKTIPNYQYRGFNNNPLGW